MINSVLSAIFTDRQVRIYACAENILLLFSVYFSHYITFPIAQFQIEILKLLQNEKNKRIAVVAFRNSAKSTFCSLLLPIWSVIGIHQKKYILIVCQTEEKAKQALTNIRQELEENELLGGDFGAFYMNDDQWNRNTLVIPKYGARITAVSVGTSIRGTRHREHRPDLIICDDIEDVQSANSKEARDRLWQFVNGELIPAGDINTRYIFIGNLVHEDSVMMRIKREYLTKGIGIYREYPLIDDSEKIFWPGKFPDLESIKNLEREQLSEIDYLREYRLKIVPDGDRIIYSDDIHRYKESDLLPRADFQYYLLSIDPAVSLKHTADKTAIIVARIYGSADKFTVYLSPHPVNKRMSWPEIIEEIKGIVLSFWDSTYKVLVEGGSTQKGLAQMLQDEGIHADEVNPQGQDKRTRLSMAKRSIQNATILFPETGTGELETQLFTFGTERYDDLVDALTLIVVEKPNLSASILTNVVVISDPDLFYSRNDSRDWADIEDEEMLATIHKGDWRKIMGD